MKIILPVFTFLASVIQFSACLTWTKYPYSITRVWNGSTVALQWDYNLTTEQQTASQTAINVLWKRRTASQLVDVAQKTFLSFSSPPNSTKEQFKPHITICRSEKATLIINNVTKEDEGVYQIIIILLTLNSFTASRNTTLVVRVQPIVLCPKTEQVKQGERGLISCNVTGDPKPNITWTKETQPGKVISYNSTLVIDNASIFDEGKYNITANNGRSASVLVELEVIFPPSVEISNKTATAVEGDRLNFTCAASGKPEPKITWTKVGSAEVIAHTPSVLVIVERLGTRDSINQYRCTASNGVGIPATATVSVIVLFAPKMTNLTIDSNPKNTTVLLNSDLTLLCVTTANPPALYHLYFNKSYIGNSSSGEFDITVEGDGVYICVPVNTVGTGNNVTLNIIAVVSPSVEISYKTATAVEGDKLNFTCTASGKPEPKIAWTKVGSAEVIAHTPSVSVIVDRPETQDNINQYQCTTSNGVGVPATATVNVTVYYKPVRNGPTGVIAVKNETFHLVCPMTGNPLPEYNWVSDDGRTKTGKTWLFQRMESRDSGSYTCLATNNVGNGTVTVSVQVVSVEKTHHMQASINKNENDASKRNSTCKTFSEVACSVLPNCVDNEVIDCGPGSIVVEFLLKFSTDVTVNQVISNLTKAVDQGKFGSLPVDTSSLRSLSPSSSTTATEPTSTVVTTTKVPECEEAIFKKKNCETKWVNVSVIIVASVVVIVVVVVITCCLHKKRKCRKHTKVKSSDVQLLSSNHSTLSDRNPFAKDSSGYHKSGPQPTMEIENKQSVEAMGGEPIPAYAKVDKSKKKDKKKNKEAAEQKLSEDQDAVVDKSEKKKKKNEQDNTYAEVDMSRKSKKKQKPGEVLYADLDEFQQMQKMPKVSTSPEPLPPIKRPEAYDETQYADITQFLNGNPDTGAELPKDDTTPAVSNTVTGRKEESSVRNTGDRSEATNETGF